jgi:flavin reductase (DIM6/NTAB) family NADH-FMN oxidoreductase RutF
MSSKVLPAQSNTMDKRQFCDVCGRFATGITIITTLGADRAPHGMTANSFTSVSVAPPLVLFCVDHRAGILAHFRGSQHFAINVLNEQQQQLSTHFARAGHDRFDGVPWYAGQSGVPLLPDVLATLECAVSQRLEAGDHDIIIGEVLEARWKEGRPLLYFGSKYRQLEPDV